MNKKIILTCFVCSLCLLFAGCNGEMYCGRYYPREMKPPIYDEEKYYSVAEVSDFFGIPWGKIYDAYPNSPRKFDYMCPDGTYKCICGHDVCTQKTIKVVGWAYTFELQRGHWALQQKPGGSPMLELKLQIPAEEINSIIVIDTTDYYWVKVYAEGEVGVDRYQPNSCKGGYITIDVKSSDNIHVE